MKKGLSKYVSKALTLSFRKRSIFSSSFRRLEIFILINVFIAVNQTITAQQSDFFLRYKTVPIHSRGILLDSLSIRPGSLNFYVTDSVVSPSFKLLGDSLFFQEPGLLKKLTGSDSIQLSYQTLPFSWGERLTHLDSTRWLPSEKELFIPQPFEIYKSDQSDLLFSKGLNYDGSFSRGFSFGNNQSLVLNSTFNLQLGGVLADDLEVLASISDANIPIQADGTTQQLQDFDKVFIQLNKGNTKLIAGDYELSRPKSYFINFYKKLQGLSVSNFSNLGDQSVLSQQGSVAISRGKFARNTIKVAEGNQGPYKLEGNEGERFLIVLSGTEKVYFDGKVLTRGEENDYVIFYDRAEIVFTTNRMITKDSRIIVEFEYADQKYVRSLYEYRSDWSGKKWTANFSFVSQQDGRNMGGSIPLDTADLRILELAGDLDAGAVRSGITKNNEGFNQNQIYYYKMFDEVSQDSFLVYTRDPDKALFKSVFTDVGTEKGSYIIDESINANGRAYKYVGKGNGNYDPIIRLTAPEQQQMYALQTHYRLGRDAGLSMEMALSYFDMNKFSVLDDADNAGLSGRITYNQKISLGKNRQWLLSPRFDLEQKGKNFQSFNPYRNAEFSRDWNLQDNERREEILGTAGLILKDVDERIKIGYGMSNFTQFGAYQGNKQLLDFAFQENGWVVDVSQQYLTSRSGLRQTSFSRPKINFSKNFAQFYNWSLGWNGEREKNRINLLDSEGLSNESFWYDYQKFYIRSNENAKKTIGFGYNQRKDYAAQPGDFSLSTTAHEYEFNGKWMNGAISNASWNLIYRQLVINNPELTREKNNSVLLGNFNHILRLWKGALNSTLNYKVSSGQEPKAEFDFREVLPGEGDYIWIDNGDGIQQRNEFQLAPFKDQANFIRISLFNNEFIRTNNSSLTQSIRFDPASMIRDMKHAGPIPQFLSKFSLVSNLRADHRNSGNQYQFYTGLNNGDSTLVSSNFLYNGIVYFNRGNPLFDMQIGKKNASNRIPQTIGFEQRTKDEWYFRTRVSLGKSIDGIFHLSNEQQALRSEYFTASDFNISSTNIHPELVWRKGNRLRFNSEYVFERKINVLGEGNEKALIHQVKLGLIYSEEKLSRINSELKFVHISYNGPEHSVLELNMLNGLKNGQNILWAIDYSKRLMKNIDVSIAYEGRKTGSGKTIHLGKAQIKSTF